MREIVKQFTAKLKNNLNKSDIKSFFEKRHLTESDIDLFCLGYADNMIIENAEIINRLVFPMIDINDNINSLSCRIINEDDFPKVKTPTKDGFSKPIYGLNLSAGDIKFYDSAIIVEGQMDFISFFKHSLTNTVALAGSDLTKESAISVYNLTNNWIYALDHDEAGRNAVFRNVFRHFDLPLNIRVQTDWKDCKDPDEFIWKYGVSETAKALNHSQSLIQFLSTFDKQKVETSLISACSSFDLLTKCLYYAEKLQCNVEDVRIKILKKLVKSFADAEKYCYIISPQSKSAVDYGIAYFAWKGKQKNIPCDTRFPKFEWLNDKRINSKRLPYILNQVINEKRS